MSTAWGLNTDAEMHARFVRIFLRCEEMKCRELKYVSYSG